MTRREFFTLPLAIAASVAVSAERKPDNHPEPSCPVMTGDIVYVAGNDMPFTVLSVKHGTAKLMEHTREGWYKPAGYARVETLKHCPLMRFRDCGCICDWTP